MSWKLKYGAVTQELWKWGLTADFEVNYVNKGKDTVTLRTTERFDVAAPKFTYDGPVTLYDDAGAVVFQGFFGKPNRVNSGPNEWVEYPAYNAWWKLERLTFKQTRLQFAGFVDPTVHPPVPKLTKEYTSEIYVGEKPDTSYQTNGAQVVEILNWANECHNPTRRGTGGNDASKDLVAIGVIDVAVNIPKSRINDTFCSEVIVNVLRWSPDAVVWFDYSTTPPTINVTSLANSAVVNLNITAEQEKGISVSPDYDRQLNGVMIHYRSSRTVDGTTAPFMVTDSYPGDRSDLPPTYDGSDGPAIDNFTIDVSVHTVDLSGMILNRLYTVIETVPVNAQSPDLQTRIAWWKANDDGLKDVSQLDIVDVDVATVKNRNGNLVSLATFPNKLTKGNLLQGMNAVGDVTVTANVKYTHYHDVNKTTKNTVATKKPVSVKLTLTDKPSGTYSVVQQSDPGEVIPFGVAKAVYKSIKTLQHSGWITLTAKQARSDVKVGRKLALVGPNNTYTNLVVQGVTVQPHYGTVTAQFGPSAFLDAPELVELARISRWRIIYNMPSGRADGGVPGGSGASGLSDTPKENTVHAPGTYSVMAATVDAGGGNVVKVAHDADAQVMSIENLKVDGIRDASKNHILLRIVDIAAANGGRGATAFFQQITWKEVDTCVKKKAWVLMTLPEDA